MDQTYLELLREASRLSMEAAQAVERKDFSAAGRLQQEADAAYFAARRLGRQHVRKVARAPKEISAKVRTVSVLTELGVASSPRQIAAYAMGRWNKHFDVRSLASIRRDEKRSWDSGSKRDIYVVPTLEGPWFVPGRGRFALSHWPLWMRIIGPLSPRADHLRACMNLVGQVEQAKLDQETEVRLRRLIVEYACTVSGALAQPWEKGEDLDPDRVMGAVKAEFDLIGAEDEVWRKEEAERAQRLLSDEQRIWGGSAPELAGGRGSGI